MHWNDRGELKFQVHLKPNQKLKYLNADSTHLPSTFKAIPAGVINRLSKLTSMTKARQNTTIDETYPHHAKALKISGIAPKKNPHLPRTRNPPHHHHQRGKSYKEKGKG